jgi:kinesin family member 11
LLQESLGGQAKTCIIATLSASADSLEETRATLLYAARAKNIRNKPMLNQNLTNKTQIRDYVTEIESLKNQLYVCDSEYVCSPAPCSDLLLLLLLLLLFGLVGQSARTKDGLFVPNELWSEMQQHKAELDRQLEELSTKHELQSQELESVTRMFERKSHEAETATAKYQQTKVELDETTERLRQTTDTLQATQTQLAEQQGIVCVCRTVTG